MNFILKPSLEHIALVQVAANLWNHHDIKDFHFRIFQFDNSELYSQSDDNFNMKCNVDEQQEWDEIKERVIEKVSQLTIPTSLKEKVLGYIKPVGLEICKWKEYHTKCCSLDLGLRNKKFCWTLHGTIDKKKTAEVLIKDDAIDITTRYKLACIYCLEDDILELWYELPESYKIYFDNEESIENNFQRELLMFWEQYMKDKEANKDNTIRSLNSMSFSDSHMIQCATESGNKTAAEYFLQRVIQKEELLSKLSLDVLKKITEDFPGITNPTQEYYSEVLCFLLTQMNDDQQVQIFKECPLPVFRCLLDCSWQNFFLEKVNCLWNFLLAKDYIFILEKILQKVHYGCKVINYQKLFQYVWLHIPHSDKSLIITNDSFYAVLILLLRSNDRESIELIFQSATIAEKNKVIFGEIGQFLWLTMVYREEWSLLKYFIPLCISSKHALMIFKQQLELQIHMRWHSSSDLLVQGINKSKELFRILDDIICKCGEYEDDCSHYKKFKVTYI